jgi:hypothetical protein
MLTGMWFDWDKWQSKRAQLPSQGGEAVACFRILNTLGDVVTEWQDGPPPARFTDLCGVVQADVFAQVAYTHPADQVAEGVAVSRELRSVLAMILNALDRDAVEGKQARGEMAEELRALLNGGQE